MVSGCFLGVTGGVWVVSVGCLEVVWGCLGGVWEVSGGFWWCLGGVGWCLGGVLDTFTPKMIFDKNDKVLECLIPSLLREVMT